MLNFVNGTEGHDNITATDADDEIIAFAGNDFIFALGGNDFIDAGVGHDVINGGDGNDTILAGAGFDISDGGEGSDVYLVGLENLGFVDTYGDTGTRGTDSILAVEDNTVIGLINGFGIGSGIEVISGQAFENVTIGGTGGAEIWNFSAITFENIVSINSGAGNDNVTGNDQANTIDGGAGQDVLNGGGGDDTLIANTGNDILNGGLGADTLIGGAGFDILDGGEGSDTYLVGLENLGFVDTYADTGANGFDSVLAIEDNTVIGLINGFGPDSGIELISGQTFENVTIGGTNDAEIWDFSAVTLENVVSINAGAGNDTVTGNDQANTIDGGADQDILNGRGGDDTLIGGTGNDILNGGDGQDRLDGGEGNDILNGGDGSDTFVFSQSESNDVISDFTLGSDILEVEGVTVDNLLTEAQISEEETGLLLTYKSTTILLLGLTLADIDGDEGLFIFFFQFNTERAHRQVRSDLHEGVDIVAVHLGDMLTQLIFLDLRNSDGAGTFQTTEPNDIEPAVLKEKRYVLV